MFCRLKVRSYVLAANVAGTLKVAPLQILKFPVVLPHKFLDAEKFNLRFSDASEITEIADKLRWYRYQKGLRQRDAADYAGIDRSTYIHYEEAGRDFYPKEHLTASGDFGRGPFTMEARKEILRRLLRLEVETGFELITSDELKMIDKLWEDEGDLSLSLIHI